MLKWTFGYYNFLTQASVIFIQENTAFIQVLIYQDWHNQLLNTINFISLLNFKESFFNYFNLGEKVTSFSERSSRRFSSAVGAYWKHCFTMRGGGTNVDAIFHNTGLQCPWALLLQEQPQLSFLCPDVYFLWQGYPSHCETFQHALEQIIAENVP